MNTPCPLIEKPWYLEAIGMYAKDWYGYGTSSYHDLSIIMGHLSGYTPSEPDKKELFRIVSDCFFYLVGVSGHKSYIDDAFKEVFFPWRDCLHRGSTTDEKMLNEFLSGIRQHEKKYFGEMVMDARIARLFLNGQDRIDAYKSPNKGWVGTVIND